MENVLYGLAAGLVVALLVFIFMAIRLRSQKSASEKENARLKQMLTDRMELESEGLNKLKAENEELKKANENLRISIQTYSQKPGRKELERLTVYQKAVDRLIERVREDLCRGPGLHTEDHSDEDRCSGHRRD